MRTGDHTFIGQIASLTGAESGNESPLAVEMCVSFILPYFHYLISPQRPIRRQSLEYRCPFRRRILRRRDHHGIQRSRITDRHLRGVDPGSIRTRGSPVGRDAITVYRGEEDGKSECLGEGFARGGDFGIGGWHLKKKNIFWVGLTRSDN